MILMRLHRGELAGFILLAFILVTFFWHVQAVPAQQYATNTPLADGSIVYVVEAGDTCTRMQLLYGISLEQLRALNPDVNTACTNLRPGQNLLIAGAAASPTETTRPAVDVVIATPLAGTADVCVDVYDDLNGNARRDVSEPYVPGLAIHVTQTDGHFSNAMLTPDTKDAVVLKEVCFTDVPEGHYSVSAGIPIGYSPKTATTLSLNVSAGNRYVIPFAVRSAESSGSTAKAASSSSAGGTSPIVALLGGVLVIGGLGLGWYALRIRKSSK